MVARAVSGTSLTSISSSYPHQLPYCPLVVSQSLLHCRSDPQRLVSPAEVVIREPERVCGFKVLPLFREGIGKPCHAPHPHADTQVLPFNMTRANSVFDWSAHDFVWDRVHNFSRAVSLLAIAGRSIDFDELSEVYAVAQDQLDSAHVRLKAIRGQLVAVA